MAGAVATGALYANAEPSVVRAVLFYSEGCSHCQVVVDQVLPPLQTRYGGQLQVAMIEVSGKEYDYFRQVADYVKLPAERRGVPALIIGDRVLVGDQEIPNELPGLIQTHLEAGGLDYPALPGLAERLPKPAAGAVAKSSEKPAAAQPASNGFGLATAIAVFLVLSVLYALASAILVGIGRAVPQLPGRTEVLIPILCVIGLGVAGYLTFVETQNVAAVCGPIGDCNSVQSSPYARLFGLLPVGVLGLAGYVGMIAAWAVSRWGRGDLAAYAPVVLLAMALFGVLFSLYLTYIELAVILAVCIWCLTSALLMALILILAVGPAMCAFMGEDEESEE